MTPTPEQVERARAAKYDEFWRGLSRAGDPARIPNKVLTGFNAGWEAGAAFAQAESATLNRDANPARNRERLGKLSFLITGNDGTFFAENPEIEEALRVYCEEREAESQPVSAGATIPHCGDCGCVVGRLCSCRCHGFLTVSAGAEQEIGTSESGAATIEVVAQLCSRCGERMALTWPTCNCGVGDFDPVAHAGGCPAKTPWKCMRCDPAQTVNQEMLAALREIVRNAWACAYQQNTFPGESDPCGKCAGCITDRFLGENWESAIARAESGPPASEAAEEGK